VSTMRAESSTAVPGSRRRSRWEEQSAEGRLYCIFQSATGELSTSVSSARPKTSPTALPAELFDLIVRVRKELTDAGLDAGPETVA
jgi:hypothetical protein